MFRVMFFLVMLLNRKPEIDCGEERENESLDKGHQEFEEHHEYVEQNGND